MTFYKYLLVTGYRHIISRLHFHKLPWDIAQNFSGPLVSAMLTIRSMLAIHIHRPPKLPQKFSKHTVNETNSGSPVGMVNTHCSYWGLTGADPNFGGVSPIKLNSQPPAVSPKLFQPPIRGEIAMRIRWGSPKLRQHTAGRNKNISVNCENTETHQFCGRFLNKTFQATGPAVACTATTQLSKNKFCRQQIWFHHHSSFKKGKYFDTGEIHQHLSMCK